MASFPKITYTNVKHKVATGVSNGEITTADENISVVFNRGLGDNTSFYRVSYNAPFNSITGNYTTDTTLARFEIRVNPIEDENYGPGVGNLLFIATNVTISETHNFSFTVTSGTFTGSTSNTYRICLLAQSELDYSWDFTQLFMTIGPNDDPTNFIVNYKEVEYIEATGNQRIKLNITPKSTYKIEEKFAITDRSVTSCIWCARGSTTGTSSLTAFNIANSQVRCDYGTSASMINIGAITANQVYTLTMNANKWYLDGELKTTMTAANFTAGSALQLFASHYNGQDANLGNYAKSKLYYFKVWDETGTLICKLIPCIRKSDDKPGLFDTVSRTFYVNNNSGADFKVGTYKISEFDGVYERFKPTDSEGIETHGMGYNEVVVGPAYQRLMYIQSSGTQYVDIDYICNRTDITVELDMTWTGSDVNKFETFCGFMYSTSQVNPRLGMHKFQGKLMFGANDTRTSTTALTTDERFIYKGDFTSGAQKLYKNGSLVVSGTTAYNFTSNTCPTYVFARYCPNSMNYAYMKLHEFKLYEGTHLVKHLIPAKRLSDNAVGLYDLMGGVLYTNKGTGSFTAGPEL